MSRHPHVEYAMTIPGEYTEVELESLRQEIEALPDGSTIVEIGILYGRTASLYMQASLDKTLDILLIDNWCVNRSDALPYFTKMLHEYYRALEAAVAAEEVRSDVKVLDMDSKDAIEFMPKTIDLLHIDGNHHDPGPQIDCGLYLPRLKSGMVAVFHDYNTIDVDGVSLVFPGLHETVDKHTEGWENLGVFDRQTKRRKP